MIVDHSLAKHFYIWLSRVRQRRGYGIHSPYAFRLVTKVFYDRSYYPAYDRFRKNHSLPQRILRFYHRIAVDTSPQQIYCIGASDEVINCLKNAYPQAKCCIMPSVMDVKKQCKSLRMEQYPSTFPSLIYCPIELLVPELLSLCSSNARIIVEGIHNNEVLLQKWLDFIARKRVRVTFDLYDVGVICFEQRLNKQDYKCCPSLCCLGRGILY